MFCVFALNDNEFRGMKYCQMNSKLPMLALKDNNLLFHIRSHWFSLKSFFCVIFYAIGNLDIYKL